MKKTNTDIRPYTKQFYKGNAVYFTLTLFESPHR